MPTGRPASNGRRPGIPTAKSGGNKHTNKTHQRVCTQTTHAVIRGTMCTAAPSPVCSRQRDWRRQRTWSGRLAADGDWSGTTGVHGNMRAVPDDPGCSIYWQGGGQGKEFPGPGSCWLACWCIIPLQQSHISTVSRLIIPQSAQYVWLYTRLTLSPLCEFILPIAHHCDSWAIHVMLSLRNQVFSLIWFMTIPHNDCLCPPHETVE